MTGREGACVEFPFNVPDRWSQWADMCLRIDALEAEVDRLLNDIDGHYQNYTCVADRREP